MHCITYSTLYAAVQVSTSFLSLHILGYVGTVVFTALLCKYFWTIFVARLLPAIASITVVIAIQIVLDWLARRTTRRGSQEVKMPGWWLFFYSMITSVNLVIGFLLVVIRIALLLVISVLDISRVDRSIFPYWQDKDKGYMGFYGMILL